MKKKADANFEVQKILLGFGDKPNYKIITVFIQYSMPWEQKLLF